MRWKEASVHIRSMLQEKQTHWSKKDKEALAIAIERIEEVEDLEDEVDP